MVNFAAQKMKSTQTLLEIEKAMEHEGNGDTNCNWCTWNDP